MCFSELDLMDHFSTHYHTLTIHPYIRDHKNTYSPIETHCIENDISSIYIYTHFDKQELNFGVVYNHKCFI